MRYAGDSPCVVQVREENAGARGDCGVDKQGYDILPGQGSGYQR